MDDKNKIEYENIQITKQVGSFQEFIELREQGEYVKASFLIPTEMFIVTDNIRPFNQDHIDRLATSIEETGQKTPCIGDIVWDDDNKCWSPRLIAGQHRYKAIQQINERRRKEGLPEISLWITLENRTYDPYEVIDIQLAENIHEKMTASEEGIVLYGYYRQLYNLMKADHRKLTVAEFSKRVGRTAETVRNAIKFIDGLDPRVRKLVDEKKLPYTHALLLTALPQKGTDFMTTQYEIANHIFRQKLSYEKAKRLIKDTSVELGCVGPLFGKKEWRKIKKKGYFLTLKNTAGINSKAAAMWVKRVAENIKQYDIKSQKVMFTTAVLEPMQELGITFAEYEPYLKQYFDKELLEELSKQE
ncbi:MAG: hypothetical protein UR69_C0006G0002 [Candidatus Moranbacteria bacterium GW2011_GWE2_35_2-]|nr:MAG: hypothetical protein UR69_C0006G0002 [Candidatus Moranbacteria bacterium GW2011_GWE2_35_2-]